MDPMYGTGIYDNLSDCEQKCHDISTIEEQYFEHNIYPNPTNGLINIDFKLLKSSDLKILIINYLGEIVLLEEIKRSQGTFKKVIDLENHAKGIYLLKINLKNQNINQKIVIQ